MLVNDPLLERAGIVEMPTWAVALTESDDDTPAAIAVPTALTEPSPDRRFGLVGLVAVGEHGLDLGDGGAGSVLARYGARHTSPVWFRSLEALLDDDRVVAATDRVAARHAIERLLAASA
jgi:hypothetical protein